MNGPLKFGNHGSDEDRLDEIFRRYRAALDDPEAGANFMPQIWARIETRQSATNWFDRFAKALVTAAVAVSVVAGLLISSSAQSAGFYKATFVNALVRDHASSLEPLSLDRISELEMARR